MREGDDPHQLAQNFVKTFQLRKSLADYIAEQIHQQLLNSKFFIALLVLVI